MPMRARMLLSVTASVMKEISATPVTPYVSKPSAVGPTESPALSPVQSAMTPGFFGSSSGSLKTIFIRSDPMSAILVKMPPQMRSTLAPSDSPMAKPMKQGPASSLRNIRMQIMKNSSTATSSRPTLMPERSGMPSVARGLPLSAEKAVRELDTVLMRMPNQATPYEPRMPRTDASKITNPLRISSPWLRWLFGSFQGN